MREMCQTFGITTLGETVESWTLENEFLTAEVLTYGATLRRLVFGGVDVVLGYDTLSEYERNDGYVGATVGRVCNRIGGASFGLNGKTYPLAKNDGENHLHGGARGFDKYIWAAEPLEDGLRLRRLSPDGEEGYPGTLAVSVTYRLAGESLRIEYEAESDADTLCSLTNHSYFNLNGGGTAMAHTLALAAERYLETSPGCLPTGRALPVAGMPFDFRAAKAVGRDIDTAAEQLRLVNGYDHHFCVDGAGLRRAAVLRGDSSGIAMTMDTTSPGVQLYTANWLSRRGGKNGAVYEPRCAVCLEPQFPPDAVHHPGFPQPLLRRGAQEFAAQSRLFHRGQKLLNVMPPFIAYGYSCGIHMPLVMGLHIIIIPNLDPDKLGALVWKYKPAHMFGVPTHYQQLAADPLLKNKDLSFIRNYAAGGDSLSLGAEQTVNRFLKAHGVEYPLAKGYGMTEVSSAATIAAGNVTKPGSVGIPMVNTVVSIFEPGTETELPIGQRGEICICTPTAMKGYYNKPEETAYLLRRHADGQLWAHTGDIGSMDEDGFVYLDARIKRIIIRHDGFKVFPSMIENPANTFPGCRSMAERWRVRRRCALKS